MTRAANAHINGIGQFQGPSIALAATSNQVVMQSAGVTGTLTWTPTSSNKVITFPDATGTVALLSTANVFTAEQSITATGPNDVMLAVNNTDGSPGIDFRPGGIGLANTAIGRYNLMFNTTGNHNVAVGWGALFHNTIGFYNTAIGDV